MKESLINNNYTRVIDIFSTIANSDNRLRILVILQSGRHAVGDLSKIIHDESLRNFSTQTSRAIAPMRRLGLVKQIRSKKFVFYELTDLGRKVIRMADLINSHSSEQDSNGQEN